MPASCEVIQLGWFPKGIWKWSCNHVRDEVKVVLYAEQTKRSITCKLSSLEKNQRGDLVFYLNSEL